MPNHEITINKDLIGVVGYAASGKDNVAEIIKEEFGFTHISLSDILREDMIIRGITPTRETQRNYANEIRRSSLPTHFLDVAIQKSLELDSEGLVVSGIYSPVEGDYIKNSIGGVLLGVMADMPDIPFERYKRLKNRSDGSRDNLTYEEFLNSHQNETTGEYYGTNTSKLLEMADFTIINNSDLLGLKIKVIDFMKALLSSTSLLGEIDDTV